MKKTIIALLFAVSPLMASAQVVDVQPTQLDQIIQTLASLQDQLNAQLALIAKIDELKAQLDILIAQMAQPTQGGTGTTAEPAYIPQIPAPVATLTFGPQSCVSGQPIVPINLTNVDYSSYTISMTGNGATQRYAYPAGSNAIDWLGAGTYDYSLTAWSGRTQPFTEGTWEDTRKVSFAQNGTVVIDSCN